MEDRQKTEIERGKEIKGERWTENRGGETDGEMDGEQRDRGDGLMRISFHIKKKNPSCGDERLE